MAVRPGLGTLGASPAVQICAGRNSPSRLEVPIVRERVPMISHKYHHTATPSLGRHDLFRRGSFGLRWSDRFARMVGTDHRSGSLDRSIAATPSILSLASAYSEKPARLGSIDAVRGTAMLFVCLAHFTATYLWKTGARELSGYLGTIGMIASPTFVIVSGMMVGFFAATYPGAFRDLRIKLLDRGVFLLAVGHLLLTITIARSTSSFAGAYHTSFITDAIAVSIIVAPWVMTALTSKRRIAVAASVFVLNWLAVVAWHPAAAGLVMKRYLVGIPSGPSGAEILAFPVIPWFAVYLAATVLGELVGRLYASGDRQGAHQLLARMGGVFFLIAGLIDGATDVLRHVHTGIDWNEMFFFAIYQKFPPGPVYLGFFGGAGILLLAGILEIDRRGAFPGVMNELRPLGRASLFAFIAQYALYVALLGRLRLSYTPFWPVLFVFSIIVLARGAATWDRYNCNRLLTVGIAFILKRNSSRSQSAVIRYSEASTLGSQRGRQSAAK
jgi:uncharacterized membrane protein